MTTERLSVPVKRKAKKAKMPGDKQMAEAASLMGKKGGRARAKSLTPEERSAIARKAANARWSKRNEVGK